MKIIFSILIMLLFLDCNSNKESINEGNSYPQMDRFIVSENDSWLDSLHLDAKNKGMEIENINGNLPPENFMAGIHFLIENEHLAYYFMKPDFIVMCGNWDKSDSIFAIKENQMYLDSLRSIKTDSISKFLLKNKSEILNSEIGQFPRTVSFALKNDTLQGSLMHDILKLMEENAMNSYFIRRMNEDELKAVEKFNQ